jgi:hypothetical protein
MNWIGRPPIEMSIPTATTFVATAAVCAVENDNTTTPEDAAADTSTDIATADPAPTAGRIRPENVHVDTSMIAPVDEFVTGIVTEK